MQLLLQVGTSTQDLPIPSFFQYPPFSGIAPCVGPLQRYMKPTLDAVLLSGSRLYRGCRVSRLPVAGKHFFEPILRLPHGAAAGKIQVAVTPRFTRDYTVPSISTYSSENVDSWEDKFLYSILSLASYQILNTSNSLNQNFGPELRQISMNKFSELTGLV